MDILSELTELTRTGTGRAGLAVYQGDFVIVLISYSPCGSNRTTIQSGFFPFLLSEVLQLRPHHSLHILGFPLTFICFPNTGVNQVDHFDLRWQKAQSSSEFRCVLVVKGLPNSYTTSNQYTTHPYQRSITSLF